MSAVFAYSLVVSAVLLFLYPAVQLTVSKNNSFRFNRALLISVLLLSFTVPAILTFDTALSKSLSDTLPQVGKVMVESVALPDNYAGQSNYALPVIPILIAVYYSGIFALVMRSAYSLLVLSRLKRSCRKETYDGHSLYIHSDSRISPFSFGRAIFISEADKVGAIVRHESGHINANHWADIFLAEISCILLWYNPFIWLYKNLIKINHEYEADSYVINNGVDISEYQHLLIAKALERREIHLTNSFATRSSGFRRRVLFMSEGKSPETKKLLGLLLLPSLAIAILAINQPLSAGVLSKIKDFHVSAQTEDANNPQTEIPQGEIPQESKKLSTAKLPAPIVDQAPFAEVVEYALKYAPELDAPINANVRVTINEKGKVIDTEVDGNYSDEFKIVIDDVLSELRFEPARDNGRPTQIRIVLPVRKK